MVDQAVSEEGTVTPDPDLIAAARTGDTAAFSELYRRHAGAARTVARKYTRSDADADDVVSDAFAKVLAIVGNGGGPDVAFRAYLFTVVRRVAFATAEQGRRVEPTDDMAVYETAFGSAGPPEDPALAGFERGIVAQAYQSLPERWQAALWYAEIEGMTPATIAPLLGLSPNGVAALTYRAREGLRQAYLQAHLATAPDPGCATTSDKLGSYVRGGLSRRETGQVDAHLESCGDCRALVLELADVNHGMRAIVAPLVLGVLGSGVLVAPLGVGGALAGISAGAGAGAASMPAPLLGYEPVGTGTAGSGTAGSGAMGSGPMAGGDAGTGTAAGAGKATGTHAGGQGTGGVAATASTTMPLVGIAASIVGLVLVGGFALGSVLGWFDGDGQPGASTAAGPLIAALPEPSPTPTDPETAAPSPEPSNLDDEAPDGGDGSDPDPDAPDDDDPDVDVPDDNDDPDVDVPDDNDDPDVDVPDGDDDRDVDAPDDNDDPDVDAPDDNDDPDVDAPDDNDNPDVDAPDDNDNPDVDDPEAPGVDAPRFEVAADLGDVAIAWGAPQVVRVPLASTGGAVSDVVVVVTLPAGTIPSAAGGALVTAATPVRALAVVSMLERDADARLTPDVRVTPAATMVSTCSADGSAGTLRCTVAEVPAGSTLVLELPVEVDPAAVTQDHAVIALEIAAQGAHVASLTIPASIQGSPAAVTATFTIDEPTGSPRVAQGSVKVQNTGGTAADDLRVAAWLSALDPRDVDPYVTTPDVAALLEAGLVAVEIGGPALCSASSGEAECLLREPLAPFSTLEVPVRLTEVDGLLRGDGLDVPVQVEVQVESAHTSPSVEQRTLTFLHHQRGFAVSYPTGVLPVTYPRPVELRDLRVRNTGTAPLQDVRVEIAHAQDSGVFTFTMEAEGWTCTTPSEDARAPRSVVCRAEAPLDPGATLAVPLVVTPVTLTAPGLHQRVDVVVGARSQPDTVCQLRFTMTGQAQQTA